MNAFLSEEQLASLGCCYLMLGNKFCFGRNQKSICVGYDGPLGAQVMAVARRNGEDLLLWEGGIVKCMRAVEKVAGKWREGRTYLMQNGEYGFAFRAWMAPEDKGRGKPRRLLMELVDATKLGNARVAEVVL